MDPVNAPAKFEVHTLPVPDITGGTQKIYTTLLTYLCYKRELRISLLIRNLSFLLLLKLSYKCILGYFKVNVL